MASYIESWMYCVEHDGSFAKCFHNHTRAGHPEVVKFVEQRLPAVRSFANRLSQAFGGHSDAWLLRLPDMPQRYRLELLQLLVEHEFDQVRLAMNGMTNWLAEQHA